MSVPAARAIALDVGGSSIKSGIVEQGGIVVGRTALTPLDSRAAADVILGAFAGIVSRLLPDAGASSFRGVAFGFPSPFEYGTGVCRIHDLGKFDALYGINITEELRGRVAHHLPAIVFRNDAEAAIVGEARYGAGRPFHRLIGITIGTGLGSAFVVGGESAGLPEEEWLYHRRFRGVRADDWFSRRGIEARLEACGAKRDVRAAAESARAGDRTLRSLFADIGAELAEFLRPIVVSFGAEAVVVMGRIAGAFDLFGPALSSGLSVPALVAERPDDAALLGAAAPLLDLTPATFPRV